MLRLGRILAVFAASLALATLAMQRASADDWDFRMLNGGVPIDSTLTIDLGTFVDGSEPTGWTFDVAGLLRNLSANSELTIGGCATGYSGGPPPEHDGNLWFTFTGGEPFHYLGSIVGPQSDLTMDLGVFDASAFLLALPSDSQVHSALVDINFQAINGLGDPFDPDNHPDGITPGPPSLLVTGRIIPGGPVIPEAGTATLLGALTVSGALLLRLRRKAA